MSAVLKAAPQPLSALHPDERAARVRLAACYRVFAMLGWTEMIYNHITVRLPASVSGAEKQFLINPFGLHYSEVTASNLVKINLAGDVLDGSHHPVNPAGYTLHSTIHGGIVRMRNSARPGTAEFSSTAPNVPTIIFIETEKNVQTKVRVMTSAKVALKIFS